jgi:hypothetical protein
MHKFFLLLIAEILALGACKGPEYYKNRFTLRPAEKPLEITIGSETKNFVYYSQFVRIGKENYLGILNFERNRIEIYDLGSRKLFKELQFYSDGPETFGEVSGFFIENIDSLVVDCFYQRVVGISDGNGKVVKKISYDRDVNGRPFKLTPPWIGLRPYKVGNVINFLQVYQAEESYGILTEEKRKETFLNVTLNTTTGISTTLPLTYPEEMIGHDITQATNVMRTVGFHECFIYHFWNLDNLFVTSDHKTFNKYPIESNYKFKLNTECFKYIYDIRAGLINSLSHDMVRDMLYDEYRNCYYIFIMKRNENPDAGSDIFLKMKFPDCFILILDKDLKHMGEVFLPDNTYSFQFSFITPEGLYISEDHPNNPDFDEDFMRFRLFKLVKL